jgi:hypothetical protein
MKQKLSTQVKKATNDDPFAAKRCLWKGIKIYTRFLLRNWLVTGPCDERIKFLLAANPENGISMWYQIK